MSDTHCNCTMTQRLVGDGCRYCQPDTYIGILSDELADLRAYKERTEAGLQLRCEALLELLKDGDVLVRRYAKTEIDWLKQDGLWRDPPQAEVQP